VVGPVAEPHPAASAATTATIAPPRAIRFIAPSSIDRRHRAPRTRYRSERIWLVYATVLPCRARSGRGLARFEVPPDERPIIRREVARLAELQQARH
jgi:hypothetical protein